MAEITPASDEIRRGRRRTRFDYHGSLGLLIPGIGLLASRYDTEIWADSSGTHRCRSRSTSCLPRSAEPEGR